MKNGLMSNFDREVAESRPSQGFIREAGFTSTCQNMARTAPLNERIGLMLPVELSLPRSQ
jgi:hypothetical protein